MVELDRGFVSGSEIPEEYSLHSRLREGSVGCTESPAYGQSECPNLKA